jgi:4-azaleucine resistance transporter AzlC
MTESRENLSGLGATTSVASVKTAWTRGLAQGLPIVLGYVPIGFAYGILAIKSGLSPRNTVLMSLLVYAGASQFIAAGLFAAGVSPLSIVLTTFVTNLRHLLMSASLAPHVRAWPRPLLPLFAYQVTDETFAVHAASFAKVVSSTRVNRGAAFCVNVMAQIAWTTGSWLGVVGGQYIPDPRPWGLDYALPALFIALLVMQIRDRIQLSVALAAGASAVGLALLGLDQWAVILATVLGATLGMVWEQWTQPSSS